MEKRIVSKKKIYAGDPHVVYTLSETEYKRFIKIYGPTSWIELDYTAGKHESFRITGYGWKIKGETPKQRDTYYIREITFNVD